MRAVQAGPLAGLIAQVLLLAVLGGTVGLSVTGWAIGLICGVITNAALARGLSRHGSNRLRAADWVTFARASLAVGVAGLVADSFAHRAPVTLLVSISALALALDFVDGWVARRTRTTATLGAWFDGEVDAFLILVLSVYVARSAGVWVLAIGAARYAFLAAGWPLPWMRARLPPRYWRKVVAATQGIVLTTAAAAVLPLRVNQAILVGALLLLAESFGRDVWWLWTHRQAKGTTGSDVGVAAPAVGHGRLRRTIAAAFSVLAVLFVWAALVAPNQAQDLTVTAFLRVPIEGLVLIALAAVLPTIPRRILAGVLGPALALLVILKILDIAFFSAFARPFDLIGDAGDAGIGIETLRAALGHTEANLIVYGGVALAVALLVGMTLADVSAHPPRGRQPPRVTRRRSRARRRLAALLGLRRPAPLPHPDRLHERRRLRRPRGRSGTGRHPRRGRLRQPDQPRPLPRHARQPAADRSARQGRSPRVRRVLRAGLGPGLLLFPRHRRVTQ